MTVAVAMRCPEGVWIASDMLATANCGLKVPLRQPKWVNRDGSPTAACIAGDLYVVDSLHELCSADWPATIKGMVEAVRKAATEAGIKPTEQNGERPDYGIEALLTDGSTIVRVSGNLTKFEVDRVYDAIGSGSLYALGALFALNGSDEPYEHRVMAAVAAANNFDDGCQDMWGPVLLPDPEYRPVENTPAFETLSNIANGPEGQRYRPRA